MRDLILLGPQAVQPRVAEAVQRLKIKGRVCAITAGWQERAGELEALREHLGREVVHLELYRRTEQIFESDPEFFEAYRRRQNRLRELQNLYRHRLTQYMSVARGLAAREGDERLLSQERRDALDVVRRLDAHHLQRIKAVDREFDEEWQPRDRETIQLQRRKVSRLIAECDAVMVAGGHVAVLLNRLRLFNFAELVREKPVIAWSGGAMVLGRQIVLFHDSPPQGAGDAEVLEHGIGLYQGLLVLPHASTRLCLTDPVRVSLFARRFHPLDCLPFDDGAFMKRDDLGWSTASDIFRMTRGGGLEHLETL